MVGYKHPCRYCDQYIPSGSAVCPLCGKETPLGPLRCPRCRNPVQKNWQSCNSCGLELQVECPYCHELTAFTEYCQHCDERLVIKCPNEKCGAEQPPLGDTCVECGEPFEQGKKK